MKNLLARVIIHWKTSVGSLALIILLFMLSFGRINVTDFLKIVGTLVAIGLLGMKDPKKKV